MTRRALLLALVAALVAGLAACGRKGPVTSPPPDEPESEGDG